MIRNMRYGILIHRLLLPILFLVFVFGKPLCIYAQHIPYYWPAPVVEAMPYVEPALIARDSLWEMMEKEKIPGLSVAVAVQGYIVWDIGMGWADIEAEQPVTTKTQFRIASLSKPLTSAALGLIYEAGLLDLDAEIQTYVPAFPRKRWPVTTRQLAGHLAGIRHYKNRNEFYSTKHYDSITEALSIFRDDPLKFHPGSQFSYSSYGWNLISAVVEGVSSENFLDFMQERVFDVVDMPHTAPEQVAKDFPFRAQFYQREKDKEPVLAPFVDNSIKWAGGGFLSNAEDLTRFGHALMTGTLLHPETVELWFAPQTTSNGKSTHYGIGWSSEERNNGYTYYGHTGGAVGASSVLVLSPAHDAVVVILTNLQNLRMEHIGSQIMDLFVKQIDDRAKAIVPETTPTGLN